MKDKDNPYTQTIHRMEKEREMALKRDQKQGNWMLRVLARVAVFLKTSEFAFLVTLTGVLGMAFHIYHVTFMISDLEGWLRISNSALWASFFSFGVIFFTLKVGTINGEKTKEEIQENYNKHRDEQKRLMKYTRTVNWFVAFESLVNLYYWAQRLVFQPALLRDATYLDTDGVLDWTKVDWTHFDATRIEWPALLIAVPLSLAIPLTLKAYAGEIKIKV